MIFRIALGLIGLGIVVLVHELGHFIAARLTGIDVEAFSIGWGKPILKKKIGNVEYRLGMFPAGGYCKMRGENEYKSGEDGKQVEYPKGHYLAASPLSRIIVAFMGPFANLVFAILVLSVIWGLGFETQTLENRIALLSTANSGTVYPADLAGLQTGDRIIEINGRKISNWGDLRENIAINAEVLLPIKVERSGRIIDLEIRPDLDKSSGAGVIGVLNWTDPVIGSVVQGSPAYYADLRGGDRILKINGVDFPYTNSAISFNEYTPNLLVIEFQRDNSILQTLLYIPETAEGNSGLGIHWETVELVYPRLNPIAALVKGAEETWRTFTVSVRSLSLLFRGIDLTQAVSGPVRITYMMGDVAADGFSQSLGMGISSMSNFLALISIALCIMNLLPLPILDGGMIILCIVEAIRRKPLHPKTVYVFQTVGVVIIFGLMVFALFGDILFLARR